ncbi:MAG TPA: ABC transporter permease [Kineosporiaceae bacterium]|nr:ABC transporter permease [Kineosporiaceae bacterium]
MSLTVAAPAGRTRTTPRGWWRAYLLMLRFDLSSQRVWLPMSVILQVLLGSGTAVIYGFYIPHLPARAVQFLVTGAPTAALIPVGLVMLPGLISQQRTAGTFDFVWSLPIPRSAGVASTLTVATLSALPGLVITLVLAGWRYGIELAVSPSVVPAVLLTALMSSSVGLAMAHLIGNPLVVNLITNVLVFVVLLFSPISFPLSQLPDWLADAHQVLPLYHMAVVVRAGLSDGLVHDVGTSYLVLLGWTVASWLGTSWVVTRRR